eukprot:s2481_g9.t1
MTHVPAASSSSSQSGETHRPEYEPPWAPGIWELLRNEGTVEDEDEGPVIFLTSFFISHANHPFCDAPRPSRFDADFRDWDRDARFIWEDVVDDSAALDIVIVQPAPPHLALPGTIATVIVQQHMTPMKHAFLTTAVYIADPRTHFYDAAHSADPVLPYAEIIRLAGTTDVCRQRHEQGYGRCSLHVGFRMLPDAQDVQLDTGLGLTVRVPAPMSAADAEANIVNRAARHRSLRHGDRYDPSDDEGAPEELWYLDKVISHL